MNTSVMLETDVLGDAELVELCRQDDREAFGQIVARYQSLICALAYSACGDLARSEDLAQETFLAAWRGLRQLHDPARLKHWLCGIARNLIRQSARAQTRNPLMSAVEMEDDVSADQEWAVPSDAAMSKEEESILWRVLETLPRSYRDPLVMFYRSGDSAAEVAEALELSEEAVRQRIARGRSMLNERVARLVESGLRRSGPTKAFAAAVLAALPLASTQAAAATTASAAAKGAGAIKGATSASAVWPAFLNVVPVVAGAVGLWGYVENTRSQRERRFAARSCIGLLVWVVALVLISSYLFRHQILTISTSLPDAIGLSLLWLAFLAPLNAYATWMALRQNKIRVEGGETALRTREATRRGFRTSIYGSLAAMIFGTSSWLLLMASRANDLVTVGLLAAIGVAGWLAAASAVVRRPAAKVKVFVAVCWGLALVNLAVMNLRWATWIGDAALGDWPSQFAPPGINLLLVVFFSSIRLAWFLKWRLLSVQTVRRDSLIALAVFLAVLIAGLMCFRAARSFESWNVQATQVTINDIGTDGSIRFQNWSDHRNGSVVPLRELSFIISDFVHLEQVSDQHGRPLAFTRQHDGSVYRYLVPLGQVVPPGATLCLKTQGRLAGQVRQLDDGTREYSLAHWPANGLLTRRVEIYRLPAGSKVLETIPGRLPIRLRRDGRIELRVEKVIPPNGSMALRILFRQGQG